MILVFLMVLASVAAIGWTIRHALKTRDGWDIPPGDESEGGWGGGGGWTNRPSGRPSGGGGPDRDIDEMFHEVADAVGRTIKIEEIDKEKVLA